MSSAKANAKVRWGVLGAAAIALKKVIPGMQGSELCDVAAIASRDIERAKAAAERLHIAKAYGSYEELLADPDIEVIYNPLPNHLHAPWSIRAAEAGKHVLCEKPISLSVEETRKLIAVRDRTGVKIGEAFMVYLHPQWRRAKELVESGGIGELRAILGAFSYFNRDPNNIRNMADIGGGGLMDIGCYPITTSRLLFGCEPKQVSALLEFDPEMHTDRLSSAMLDFQIGHSIFTCSTQMVPYQRMQILGTKGRVEIEIPFNAPPDKPCRIFVDDGSDVSGRSARVEEFPVCDQYGLQGDAFSRAVRGEAEVPVTLENALANMAVIEALLRSAKTGRFERPEG
ncbi:MAG TPA: Gfo/Idh/MocA family oxidoreductase [Bryobacteraceae bacterium]|jgi:predicted dehydrogenase